MVESCSNIACTNCITTNIATIITNITIIIIILIIYLASNLEGHQVYNIHLTL